MPYANGSATFTAANYIVYFYRFSDLVIATTENNFNPSSATGPVDVPGTIPEGFRPWVDNWRLEYVSVKEDKGAAGAFVFNQDGTCKAYRSPCSQVTHMSGRTIYFTNDPFPS